MDPFYEAILDLRLESCATCGERLGEVSPEDVVGSVDVAGIASFFHKWCAPAALRRTLLWNALRENAEWN